VNTKKSSASASDWGSPARRDIATALLDATPLPLTAGELARKTYRDQSNVRRTADQMANEGLLVRNVPPAATRRGPKPSVAYSLAEAARDDVESRLEAGELTDRLHTGQQLVIAVLEGRQLLNVLTVIVEEGLVSRTDLIASMEGPHPARIFVLNGPDAAVRAENLKVALLALGVDCYGGVLTALSSGAESIEQARTNLERAEALAQQRATGILAL
jgi:hypothetical protein